MALVTLPHPLTAGTPARGSEVLANDNAILTQAVNGNIEDVNVKVGAAINGSKLSNVAGSRVPTDRIEDDAVTSDKLREDATVDANRAVTTDHIRDAAVTAAKIAAQAVIQSKLKLLFVDLTPVNIIPPDGSVQFTTGITTAMGQVFMVEHRRAGVPAGSQMQAIVNIWLNTSTNTYYLSVTNPTASGNLTLSGTWRVWYFAAS